MKDLAAGSWQMISTAWRMSARKTVVSLILMVSGAAAAPALAAALAQMTNAIVAAIEAVLSGSLVGLVYVQVSRSPRRGELLTQAD